MSYAEVMGKSCGEEEEEGDEEAEGEGDEGGASIHASFFYISFSSKIMLIPNKLTRKLFTCSYQ